MLSCAALCISDESRMRVSSEMVESCMRGKKKKNRGETRRDRKI
jgi:hypothetical protein